MSEDHEYPKLHNAMWPGLVGKGADSEPPLALATMIELTANARAGEDGAVRFDGVDLFLAEPHLPARADDDALARLVDDLAARELVVGSCVAPVWPWTGGGSAMGSAAERRAFLARVREACATARRLAELGRRPSGIVRIDSACSPADWARDPTANTRRIAETFREACDIAADFGERLAAEGEICWGGMHSWRHMLETLEAVDRPGRIGFQADMAHTLLYALGHNAPEHRVLPADASLDDPDAVDAALVEITGALRSWTVDFHVAQNDGSVEGLGAHDRTGRHCLPDDPAGKLDLPRHAAFWLREPDGTLTRACRHVCWDGCMFPNATLEDPATWDRVLAAMLSVRDAHGWSETTGTADGTGAPS